MTWCKQFLRIICALKFSWLPEIHRFRILLWYSKGISDFLWTLDSDVNSLKYFFLCLCLLEIQNNPSWNTKIWFLPSDTKVTDVIWTAAPKMQHHPTKPVETFTPKPQTQIKILRSSQHDSVLPTSTKGPERDRRMDGRADRSEIWWYRTPISSIYPTFRHQLLPHRSIAYNVWLSEVEEPH